MRLQPLRAILAAVVVGAGASLVVSILIITASISRSVDDAGRALAGPAPLRVVGSVSKGGVTAEDFKVIESTEGVGAAIPLVQGIALVDPDPADPDDDVPVMTLGFDCRVEALFGAFDCEPGTLASVEQAFVGTSLLDEVGREAEVRTNLGRVPLTDAVALEQVQALNDGRVVAFPLPRAQRELGRGADVDVVYVLPAPGERVGDVQAALEERLGDEAVVLDALDPPPLIGVVVANFIPIFTMVALLTLGIGGILIRNSITLSLEERRRQTAIVGALGGTQGQLVWGTIIESAFLGIVGGGLGVLFGSILARPVSGGLSDFMENLAGIPLQIHTTPTAILAGLAAGGVVAVLASVGPARRAVRIDVAAELASRDRREEALRSTSLWRLLVALVVAGGGIGLSFLAQKEGGIEPYQATLAPVAFMVTMLPCIYVVGTLVPILLRTIDLHVPFRRASSRLAVANLRREPRRTGVMAIALGFAMGMGFIVSSLNQAIQQEITATITANLDGIEVAALEPNNTVNIDSRLSPEDLKALRRLPEVGVIQRQMFVITGNEAGDLIGVSGYSDPWLDADVAVGELTQAGLDAGEVVIGPGLARAQEIGPGDEVEVHTPEGDVTFPVMGVVFNGDLGGRNVMMDFDLLEEHFGTEAPAQVLVEPAEGVSNEELLTALEQADLDPGIQIRTPLELIEAVTDDIAQQLSTMDAIQRGLLVMSFIAVLSTLLLVGIQRQREFGMLAAVGMTPGELRRMIIAEAGLVAVLGVAVTAVLALVQYWSLVLITPVIIGYKDPYVVDLGAMGIYAGVAVAVALAAAWYPSRRAGRVEVLDALRYE